MYRKGKVFFQDVFAGVIKETEKGFEFVYNNEYFLFITDFGVRII